jgi:hypothetical protein
MQLFDDFVSFYALGDTLCLAQDLWLDSRDRRVQERLPVSEHQLNAAICRPVNPAVVS